jgi:poly-gamma-glutamate synthesis protein (capsule biosynthesis protein)
VRDGVVTLFFCGDVMLGRGADQILPHPGDPRLREAFIRDARTYVELAESANGPIPRPVDVTWPWGDALQALKDAAPDVRVVNLETSITRHGEFAPGKMVHYRMNPANIPCLAVARPDVCALANNHVLDFGRRGLVETLDALAGAGLPAAGAGRDVGEARRPAVVTLDAAWEASTGGRRGARGAEWRGSPGNTGNTGNNTVHGGRRVLVFSFGMPSSGIPPGWAAAEGRAGIDLVPEPSDAEAAEIAARVLQAKRPGDVVVASIHWGSNWGYDVSEEQVRFAHRLIDGGVDVVHGHSSHHPRPVEVYRDKLVLYGCGDFIDDYEGIAGYENYRSDLRLMYFVSVDPDTGKLAGLRMAPMQARQMRLRHASREDSEWLRGVLDRAGSDSGFGSRFEVEPTGMLSLRRSEQLP